MLEYLEISIFLYDRKKVFSSMFNFGYQVRRETPTEGRKVRLSVPCDYNHRVKYVNLNNKEMTNVKFPS